MGIKHDASRKSTTTNLVANLGDLPGLFCLLGYLDRSHQLARADHPCDKLGDIRHHSGGLVALAIELVLSFHSLTEIRLIFRLDGRARQFMQEVACLKACLQGPCGRRT
ncbi:hypothetical protein D3C80_1181190 [compost metagenome]